MTNQFIARAKTIVQASPAETSFVDAMDKVYEKHDLNKAKDIVPMIQHTEKLYQELSETEKKAYIHDYEDLMDYKKRYKA